MLPYAVDYAPYTGAHVVAQLQLLLFAGLAFFVLLPMMKRTLTISLDFDWFYRRFAGCVLTAFESFAGALRVAIGLRLRHGLDRLLDYFARNYGAQGGLSQVSASSSMATVVLAVFAIVLLFLLVH
jgi:multicomponent Na+:H+ antiporter subunit D